MKKKINPGLYGTIDIGTKSVKAIVIEVNDKGQRLLNIESIEINPFDTFTNEADYNKQITEAITTLAQKLELTKCKKIISLFYNRELQVKLIDFPNTVKEEQLNQTLPWEAKKLLSSHYKEEEFSYSYCITRGNPLSIALAVVPQSILDAHVSLFNGTGITPDAVYTDIFSALALQPIIDIAGLPALSIVNFGYSGTHLNIFSAGKLKFYRFIPTGTSEMTNPPQENELEMYSQKIRFSFDYFRAVSKLNQVDALFFMGGGSSIPDVLKFEQSYFSPTKINALDISSELDISPVMALSFNEEVNSENSLKLLPFVPAIGGCLAFFQDDTGRMDLLTLFKIREKEKQLEKLAKTLPLFIGIFALLISFGILYYLYSTKSEKLDNLMVEADSIVNEIDACKLKIANKKGKEPAVQIKLCPPSMKVIEPIIANRGNLSNLFLLTMRFREPGMKIDDILIRNKSEAEQITLKQENETSDSSFGMSSQEEGSPYLSRLSSDVAEEQIKEDIDGKIVIIHGFASDINQVSRFSERLNSVVKDQNNKALPKAIKRYVNIQTKKVRGNKVEFLLKGELR